MRRNVHVKTLARIRKIDGWKTSHAPTLRLGDADCALGAPCEVLWSGGAVREVTRARGPTPLPFYARAGAGTRVPGGLTRPRRRRG